MSDVLVMASEEKSVDKSVDKSLIIITQWIKTEPTVKGLPPLVLPLSENNDLLSPEFQRRLKYFTASSNAFKWNQTNITSKTKKFLARNGFNSLFWSAMIVDTSIIPFVLDLFKDNIKYISDEEFESTFGISLNTSADISPKQLLANYFLLFAIPAKSHNQYLQEWVKRRLQTFYRMSSRFDNSEFDSHPELFLETKRRFYVYKHLVPALTLYAIDSSNKRKDIMRNLFTQIVLVMSYSGLEAYRLAFRYIDCNGVTEVFNLQTIKEDIQRITSARNVIIEKYGEHVLPFARLLNFPEVEGLDRRHYPDLAFCGHYSVIKGCKTVPNSSWSHFTFRKIQTKTPIDELKRLSDKLLPLEVIFPNSSFARRIEQQKLAEELLHDFDDLDLLICA